MNRAILRNTVRSHDPPCRHPCKFPLRVSHPRSLSRATPRERQVARILLSRDSQPLGSSLHPFAQPPAFFCLELVAFDQSSPGYLAGANRRGGHSTALQSRGRLVRQFLILLALHLLFFRVLRAQ
eukprot:3438305-Rhodomonas_salina.4